MHIEHFDAVSLLKNLALARQAVQQELDELEQSRAAIEALIKEKRAALEREERAVRDAFLAYAQATGDLTPHPAVRVRRVSRWVYDKGEALTYVLASGLSDCVRVKTELDVRAFERALDDGQIDAPIAERADLLEVAISSKLGDLLL